MHARKFTLKSRVKIADSASRDNPPPNTYNPTFTLTEQSKYAAVTFGFGSRCNVTGCIPLLFNNDIEIKETPGPGTYKLDSVFDKFKRLPAKEYFLLKERGGLSIPNQRSSKEL